MSKKIVIIGCGMGRRTDLTMEAISELEQAGLIIGARRLLDIRKDEGSNKQKTAALSKAEEIANAVKEAEEERIAILVSGDSGFYSGAAGYAQAIRNKDFGKKSPEIKIFPGISSISYLSSKTGVAWEDAEIYSLHGRTQNFAGALRRGAKFIVLSGNGFEETLKRMTEAGFEDREILFGLRMGSEKETFLRGTAESLRGKVSEPLSVMMVMASDKRMRCSGIEDAEFIRGDVPMTKTEVRAVVLSRLAIGRSDVVWDIGAGTGSISVESAIAAPYGIVYAVEGETAACTLIKKNREKFLVDNIEIVKGEAPEITAELPAPDSVFIGGSGGKLTEILLQVASKNPRARIVLTAVTIETLQNASKAFEECGYRCTEITQIAATRYNLRGIYHMPDSQSPVWVMAAELESENRLKKLLHKKQMKIKLKESV